MMGMGKRGGVQAGGMEMESGTLTALIMRYG